MTEIWPPDGLAGELSIVTVRLSMFGPARYRCPASDALAARGLRPRARAKRKPEALEPFLNGPFMAEAEKSETTADQMPEEAHRFGRRGRPLHDGVRQWTDHALLMYRKAYPADSELRPARRPWVYRHYRPSDNGREGIEYRMTAWGRCFESPDGRQRELRLPVNRLRERSAAERAVAALIVAVGDPDPRLERVRVVQFALSDGRKATVFDGTREEALASYRTDGVPAVRALLDSSEYRPGTACTSCAVAPVCPALPKAAGLLGVADRSRPRRSWSATTGRGYASCPARGYLRSLRLPTDDTVERSAAAERGRAVHAFLASRHGRRPLRPCTAEIPADWVPEGFRLPDEERELGRVLLRHHAEVCPLSNAAPNAEIRIEPRLVYDDTAADVLVLAEPDLLYQDADSWVWRETKTSGGDRALHNVLAAHPQLALAVRIFNSGVWPGHRAVGRIELEVLRPGGVDLRVIDPFASATRAAAEAVLHGQVSDWHADMRFEPVPGPGCASCEVAGWCSARRPRGEDTGESA